MRHRSGVTIIEMLVSIVLVGVVLTLTAQFFVGQSRFANLQKGLDEASGSTRIALSLITWDLQNAGYHVTASTANPAIIATNNTISDSLTIRFRDDNLAPPIGQRVIYDLGGSPPTLRRAQYADDPNITPSLNESVSSIVAMNLRYETRSDQFKPPVANVCPADTTPVPVGASGTAIENCSVLWQFKDVPERLVRQVKVQVLGRSENRIAGYSRAGETISFDGGHSYTLEQGYAYHFTEQVVITENLGR